MRNQLLSLPRYKKRIITLALDTLSIWGALVLAFSVRLGWDEFIQRYQATFFMLVWVAPVVSLPIYIRFGLYRAVLRYMSHQVLLTILKATLIAVLAMMAGFYLLNVGNIPRGVTVLYLCFSGLLLGLTRYGARQWLKGYNLKDIGQILLSLQPEVVQKKNHDKNGIPVLIYGAGEAGVQLAEALIKSREYRPVGFLDDSEALSGRVIVGKRVYFSEPSLNQVISETGAEEVLLAIPSLSRSERARIVRKLETTGLPVKTMPGMSDLASGRLKIQEIQAVDIADVLGREEVQPIPELIDQHIANKVVMVTGAGGSIGSEMVRQALLRLPKMLILFEHSEFNLYSIDQEVQRTIRVKGLSVQVVTLLGSINDPGRMVDVMRTYGVDTLYHAAAYKHVPIVQHNVSQGLRNNVLGTLYTAQAAIVAQVKNFVLISTDKAVRPTNVMGASKRLAEMVLQALSQESSIALYHPSIFGYQAGEKVSNNTIFTMVRFGNVLGSSGSVIPVFREQIRTGGPITVTHPEINRYFMSIPEAAQLVIQAGAMGTGGDVFVLEMGEPVKIVDLARRMIVLSGLSVKDEQTPDGDIEITFSGLRPGEKLYEELLIGESVTGTDHPKISRAYEEFLAWEALKTVLDEITGTLQGHNYKVTRELLLRYVNGYQPSSVVVDWLYKQAEHEVEVDSVGR
ncbi:polysaccharide biosynthesis protein [Endozoicomonas ascidiicola]|uniref:polysaccharide biosynthesis protein n=1 Tax=Endozoicomonas ascidiicola TaxID=1698521 RepID=UPI000A7CF221|nr:nucleoside-diphosphate sugar epimerase/dehydratase [Endozoicomonas ascidiicola]